MRMRKVVTDCWGGGLYISHRVLGDVVRHGGLLRRAVRRIRARALRLWK